MTTAIRVKISPPIGPLPPGGGFYQLEEDRLHFQLGSFIKPLPFFSYIESDTLRLEIDRRGRLLFIDVLTPRRQWETDRALSFKTAHKQARLAFLDFRRRVLPPRFVSDSSGRILRVVFGSGSASRLFALCANLTAEISADSSLLALEINNIVDDLAGQELTAFRKQHNLSLRSR